MASSGVRLVDGVFRGKLRVQLVQFASQHCFRRQHRLVLSNESRRRSARKRILDDLIVLRRAKQHADRGTLVGLPHVAVEGLEVELKLAEIRRLELLDLKSKATRQVRPR